MSWGAFIVGALAVTGAGLQLAAQLGRHGERDRIQRDLEILGKLPADSSVRSPLLEHVEQSVRKLLAEETEKRRDPVGIVTALFFIGAALGLAWGIVSDDLSAWLWPLAFLLGVLGAAGLAMDATKARRDDSGHRVRDPE